MATPTSALLARLGTDEYVMPPPGPHERDAQARLTEHAASITQWRGESLRGFLSGRMGTAAALRAIDAAAGGGFYALAPEAAFDPQAADEAFAGLGPVVDVQTHFVASARTRSRGMDGVLGFIREVAPDRFAGLDRNHSLGFAEYLRCVFLESETAIAVLTAAPGDDTNNILPNHEISMAREILDRCAGSGRLLHHAIVHPDTGEDREGLESLLERCRPSALKVYTLVGSPDAPLGWRLDDQEIGLPFLARARDAGIQRICAHKGLSGLSPTGSPDDIGPAARAHPDLDFFVYHSGYEVPRNEADEEGAYLAGGTGTNRLVRTLEENEITAGANVWAELGSTWACLVRRPREAAHVLGKLLLAVGPERVLWGTDSVWYGPAQPLIDAFRAFQIPATLRERYGYPELTAQLKADILGGNAMRAYGIDPKTAAALANNGELAWTREAVAEARRLGLLEDAGA